MGVDVPTVGVNVGDVNFPPGALEDKLNFYKK